MQIPFRQASVEQLSREDRRAFLREQWKERQRAVRAWFASIGHVDIHDVGVLVGLVFAVMAISGLHYLASPHIILLHEILRRLYYVPIVVGATHYGAKGGLAMSTLSSVLYLPHIMIAWSDRPHFEIGLYGELILFNVIGAVTGLMADRVRSERNRYRRTSEELEVAYKQLEASTDELLKAERMAAVGRVAASMAHEIRTPLSTILGCFEILGGDFPPDHPKREFVEILRKEITRAEGVVAAFLDFAQPVSPRVQAVDLHEILRGVVNLATPALAERRAGPLIADLDSPSVLVSVDAHQIQRAIIELVLVGSALAPRGFVKLSIAPRRGPRATIRIFVEPVEQWLPGDLFEPFADGLVAHGLTLPLVRRLIENQDGSVKAVRRDRRLEFTVELPMAAASSA